MHRGRRLRGGKLLQRRQVIQDPERAALRAHDQVVVPELQVADRHDRQVALERLPAGAVVDRDEQPEFRSRVEQARAPRVFAHHADRVVGRDAVPAIGNAGPGLSVVVGAPGVGCVVVQAVAVRGDVGASGHMPRQVDAVDRGELRHAGRRDVLPRASTVSREVHASVVAAGPEHLGIGVVFGEGEDRVEHLHAGLVAIDRATGHALRGLVVRGQIRTDHRPVQPSVTGAVHHLRGVVDHVPVMRRHDDRGDPLEAVPERGALLANLLLRVGDHVAARVALRLVAVDGAAVAAAVEHVGVVRMERDRPRLAAAGIHPRIHGVQRVGVEPGGHRDGRVVLLGGVDAIRKAVVHDHVVEFSGRQQVHAAPRFTARQRDDGSAVIAEHHDLRICRIDPEVVSVAMRN